MVSVARSRQAKKTTLARPVLGADDAYLSWDIVEHRDRIISRGEWPAAPMLALDEIHKYRSWRALLKGRS